MMKATPVNATTACKVEEHELEQTVMRWERLLEKSLCPHHHLAKGDPPCSINVDVYVLMDSNCHSGWDKCDKEEGNWLWIIACDKRKSGLPISVSIKVRSLEPQLLEFRIPNDKQLSATDQYEVPIPLWILPYYGKSERASCEKTCLEVIRHPFYEFRRALIETYIRIKVDRSREERLHKQKADVGVAVIPEVSKGDGVNSEKEIEEMEKVSQKVKVLFFAANPKDTPALALDKEIREIETKIRATEYRDSLTMVQKWAARYDDLHQALLEHKPHIVHFSAHGTKGNQILLLDGLDNAKPVDPETLKRLFSILKDNIRGVIFNTCYSKEQAVAVTEIIDFAIGITEEIGDEEAILFAASFYRGIGFNRSVKEAFRLGINILEERGVDKTNLPRLIVREGVDPSSIYLLPSI